MGTFLQTALFPGCDETSARMAVKTAANKPELDIDPDALALPVLRDILEQNLPPHFTDDAPQDHALLYSLPSAFSYDYIRNLLQEEGVREFSFENKTPQEIIDTVSAYCMSVPCPESKPLCQRLSVLAAFCCYWMPSGYGYAWGYLDRATYEPVCIRYEKPTDVYVLRARAALTEFTKRHRALRDLKRLIELDPGNTDLYQAEIRKWEEKERQWRSR